VSYYRNTKHTSLELITLPARSYIRRHLLSVAFTVSSRPGLEVIVRLYRRECSVALFS